MRKRKTIGGGRSEVEKLRARLAEAEETLRAIRSGEVDAIAVDGPAGQQFFTLQGADQPYRILAERMSEGAASLSAEGTILFCNQRLEEMLGRSSGELLGSPVLSFAAGSEQKTLHDLLARAADGEARGEVQFRRKDGALIPVLASLKIIPLESRNGLCLVATDLSERKRAEETIRFQATEHATLISTTSDGYWAFDAQGVLLDVNDAYCQMSGYRRDELLRMRISDLQAKETAVEIEQHIQRVVGRGFDRFDSQHRKKDGGPFDVEISVSHVPGTGRFLLFVRDISRRKAAEAEVLRLNQELENRVQQRTAQLQTSIRELESFSYSVSHDLRAPLRAINGFARMLIEDYGPSLPPEAQEHLQLIHGNAIHLGELIDDLLAFARLGRRDINGQAVNPNEIIAQAIEDLGPELDHKKVHIRVAELPPVEADPQLIRQVFVNLIGNAVKYSSLREHPKIEIGSTTLGKLRQEVGEREQTAIPADLLDPSTVVYFVRDNGAGFDMRYANKLFGVFQRLHRQDEFEGTGVGLATVQRIIHKHGGRVWAFAEVEKGATFYFTVAASAARERQQSAAATASAPAACRLSQ